MNLPAYLAIVSTGDTAVLIERASSFEDALPWCEDAMRLLGPRIEQIAIVRVHSVHWLHIGEGPALAPVRGWRWVGDEWREAEQGALNLTFKNFLPPTHGPGHGGPVSDGCDDAASLSRLVGLMSALGRSLQQLQRYLLSSCSRRQVLVVCAAQLNRPAIDVLEREHVVTRAQSYADALVLLATSVFDAVMAPEQIGLVGSGLTLLSEVRDRWPRVQRFLCTTRASELGAKIEPGLVDRVLEIPLNQELLLASLR